MGDNGIASPPAKKRVASRQLCKDDGSDSEDESFLPQQESGTFPKASEDVLASRRIVKVRRTATPVSSAPNPLAAIRLVAPSSTGTSQDVTSVSSVALRTEEKESKSSDATENDSKVGVNDPEKEVDEPEKKANISLEGADQSLSMEEKVEEGANEKISVNEEAEDAADQSLPMEEKVEEGANEKISVIEEAQDAEQGAIQGEEEIFEANELNTKAQEGPENKVEDENGGEDKLDDEGKDCNNQGGGSEQNKFVQSDTSSSEQLSSTKNAFAGTFGTGFSNSSFSFGTTPSTFGTPTGFASFRSTFAFGSGSVSGSGSAFGFKAASEGAFSSLSTGFGKSNGAAPFQLFGSQASSVLPVTSDSLSAQPPTGSVSFQEVPLETGEEQENVVFASDATLFEYFDGGWKERGKGEIKINVSGESGGRSRLLMRSKGNYRLLLNASLFPDMKTTSMDSRGVTFVCVNSAAEGKKGLTTYAVKLKDSLAATGFRETVDNHKGKSHVDLKTPENSPRAPHESDREIEASEP